MISEQLAALEHMFLVCIKYTINKNKVIGLCVYLQACFVVCFRCIRDLCCVVVHVVPSDHMTYYGSYRKLEEYLHLASMKV